jgi:hypothetical protein
MSYNGWTNYETWNANVWLDEEGNYWREEAQNIASQQGYDKDDSAYELARVMESYYEEYAPQTTGMYADFLSASMSRINWYEIAGHYVDEVLEDRPDEIEE